VGYDLHITRKADWPDDDGPVITFEEWIAVVDADPDLRLDGFCAARMPDGGILRLDDSSIAVWTAYSRYRDRAGIAWFRWRDGNVNVKNPDREIRRKMWRIAQVLAAKVQGDDGEFYDRFGNPTFSAAFAQSFWLALARHLGLRSIRGDPVGDPPPTDIEILDATTPAAQPQRKS